MSQLPSIAPWRGQAQGKPFRFAAILAALGLLIASCGTNSGTSAPGGSAGGSGAAGPASQAPAISPAASVSGTLTVWAMGNEGVKLKDLAASFMKDNPGTTVNVTPVDWGQAVAKLQTAIAGHQTPDVSQMGTDMMGQFAATQALEPVPANFQQSAFYPSAWNTNIVNGTVFGVPWYVETRLLYYRTDIAQKAGISAPPATWDDLTADAKAMQAKGGAKYGISLGTNNWQEYFPFLWSNGGVGHRQLGQVHPEQPAGRRGADLLRLVLQGRALPEGGPRRLRHHAGIRRRHPPDVLLRPVAHRPDHDRRWRQLQGQVGDRADPEEGHLDLLRGRRQHGRLQGQQEQGPRLEVRPVPHRSQDPGRLVRRRHRPAGRPGRVGRPALKADPNVAKFGEQLKSTQAQPAISTWSEVSTALNAALEKMTKGTETPQAAADEMQAAAEKIGTGN